MSLTSYKIYHIKNTCGKIQRYTCKNLTALFFIVNIWKQPSEHQYRLITYNEWDNDIAYIWSILKRVEDIRRM